MRDLEFMAWNGKKMFHDVPVWGNKVMSEMVGEGVFIPLQFTGRKDSNDVKVFESMILAQPNDQKAWESSEDIEGFSGERAVVVYDGIKDVYRRQPLLGSFHWWMI